MMLTTTLPLLPPPSTSLLPSLNPYYSHDGLSSQSSNLPPNGTNPSTIRRPKPLHPHQNPRNSTLSSLNADERLISSRKTAIAMYGYSWLKPAGCLKTMLGRREEEIEREEVEAQLREVELQERLALEAEENERVERLRGQAALEAGGGVVTGEPGERDLDEDIPDADVEEGEGDFGEGFEGDDGDEMGMGVDLDGDVPDAEDGDGSNGFGEDEEDEDDEDEMVASDGDWQVDANWSYDSRREPDTDEEEDDEGEGQRMEEGETGVTDDVERSHLRSSPTRSRQYPTGRGIGQLAGAAATIVPGSEYETDERDAEAIANAMLDEDEMGEMSYTGLEEQGGERDLDDDVPEADEEWEHTDTELEESEMDISLLPGQTQIQTRSPMDHAGIRQAMSRARDAAISSVQQAGRHSPRLARSMDTAAHPSSIQQPRASNRAVSGNIPASRSRFTAAGGSSFPASRSISMTTPSGISTPLNPSNLGAELNSDINSTFSNVTTEPDSSMIEIDSMDRRRVPVPSNNPGDFLARRPTQTLPSARRTLFTSHAGRRDIRPINAGTTTGVTGRLFTPSPAQIREGVGDVSSSSFSALGHDGEDGDDGDDGDDSTVDNGLFTGHTRQIFPQQINNHPDPGYIRAGARLADQSHPPRTRPGRMHRVVTPGHQDPLATPARRSGRLLAGGRSLVGGGGGIVSDSVNSSAYTASGAQDGRRNDRTTRG